MKEKVHSERTILILWIKHQKMRHRLAAQVLPFSIARIGKNSALSTWLPDFLRLGA
jgi:hypothetical protein